MYEGESDGCQEVGSLGRGARADSVDTDEEISDAEAQGDRLRGRAGEEGRLGESTGEADADANASVYVDAKGDVEGEVDSG